MTLPEFQEPLFEGEEPAITVPVTVKDPVEVRLLPAISWTVYRLTVSDTTGPLRASGRNPYRKVLRMWSETNEFLFGSSQEQVRLRDSAGSQVQGVTVELTHTEEVWINNTATETTPVTVIEESWPA